MCIDFLQWRKHCLHACIWKVCRMQTWFVLCIRAFLLCVCAFWLCVCRVRP